MAKPLEELIAEKARLRMSDGGKGTSFEAPLITTKEVAKAIGVSKATYERGKKVRDKGSEEAKKRARSKKYAINSAYRETMKQQRQEQLLEQEVHNYLKGNLMLFRDNCNRLFQIHRP
jgi:Asp-tRNA(Asn)/Glu-tRNA(Gln) amidotransferase A subunit family amidase